MAHEVIVVNRGKRTYSLRKGPNGEERNLVPGGSIETLDAEEAKHLLRYHDLQDMAKASPQTAARIEEQQKEIERLKAENDALKPTPPPEPEIKKPAPKHADKEEEPAHHKARAAHKKGK